MKKNFKLYFLILAICSSFFSMIFDVNAEEVEEKACDLTNKLYYHRLSSSTSSKTNPETYSINFYTCDDVYTINFRIKVPQGNNHTKDKVNAVINISKSELQPGKYYSTSDSKWSIMLSEKFIVEILNSDNTNDDVTAKCNVDYTKCAIAYSKDDFTNSFNQSDVNYFKNFNIYSGGKNNHDSGIKGETEFDPEITKPDKEISLEIDVNNCKGLFGINEPGYPAYYIFTAFNIMKYLSILILIVFTVMDYFKAIISKDEDAISKSNGRFVKRFILAIVIFVLPILLETVMEWAGLVDDVEICGITNISE